ARWLAFSPLRGARDLRDPNATGFEARTGAVGPESRLSGRKSVPSRAPISRAVRVVVVGGRAVFATGILFADPATGAVAAAAGDSATADIAEWLGGVVLAAGAAVAAVGGLVAAWRSWSPGRPRESPMSSGFLMASAGAGRVCPEPVV